MEAEAERGLVMRMLLHSPKDMVAGALAFAAVTAIIANALFLQAGRHPSPMFGTVTRMPAAVAAPASPLPRPRPVEAAARAADPVPSEPRVIELKSADARMDAKGEPKSDPKSDPMTNLVKATATPQATPSSIARPPAPFPASRNETIANQTPAARRVASVQRTLTEYGYGQLKPTGTVGSDTQAAIQKFERERKLPVTGQVSDRLVKELTAMIGRPVD
jgi:hypothetical protein